MTESKDTSNLPKWLTTSLMEKALKSGLKNDDLKIVECEGEPAAIGDHYGSEMYRYSLTVVIKPGQQEKISVIVKTPATGKLLEEIDSLSIFAKEAEAYLKVLPVINSYLEKAYGNEYDKLWPDCYYYQGLPEFTLVLEDLRPAGFALESRSQGLDLDHSILVIKALAKLHAGSLLLMKNNQSAVEKVQSFFWQRENEKTLKKIIEKPFIGLSADLKDWPAFDRKEVFLQKIRILEKTILEKVYKSWDLDKTKLNVLLHGDSWVNNFMFKHDSAGKVTGVKLVDFQIMTVNSPAMDLQYFIFSSVKPELRFTHIDHFLKVYHETFEETAKKLEFRLPVSFTLQDLRKDFEKRYFWGFIVLCCMYPIVCISPNENFDIDQYFFSEGGSAFTKYFQKDNVRNVLRQGFAFFEDKGIL